MQYSSGYEEQVSPPSRVSVKAERSVFIRMHFRTTVIEALSERGNAESAAFGDLSCSDVGL